MATQTAQEKAAADKAAAENATANQERISVREQVKKDHPNWTDEQVAAEVTVRREREKRERFEKVAVRRTRTAIKALDALARTGNRNVYSYREDEAEKILHTLAEKLDNVRHSFSGDKASEPEFTL